MDYSLPGSSVHRNSLGKSTGVGSHSLLWDFPTRGSTQVSYIAVRFFTSWAARDPFCQVQTSKCNLNLLKTQKPVIQYKIWLCLRTVLSPVILIELLAVLRVRIQESFDQEKDLCMWQCKFFFSASFYSVDLLSLLLAILPCQWPSVEQEWWLWTFLSRSYFRWKSSHFTFI